MAMLTLSDLHPLTAYLTRIAHLQSAASVLSWDQETYMPHGGAAARADALATLQSVAHQQFTAPELEDLLARGVAPGTLRRPAPDRLRVASPFRDGLRVRPGAARSGGAPVHDRLSSDRRAADD